MAITLGSTKSATGTSTSPATTSFTVSGSDAVGVVLLWVADTNALSGTPTWNGVSLTALSGNPVNNAGPSYLYGFYIMSPTTGTINASLSSSRNWDLLAIYYNGADTASQPDVQTTFGNSNTMSMTSSVTIVEDQSWAVMMGRDNYGAQTASTNTTSRINGANGSFVFDSNGGASPGSFSQTITDTNPAYISGFQVGIKPAGGGGGGPVFIPRVSFIM